MILLVSGLGLAEGVTHAGAQISAPAISRSDSLRNYVGGGASIGTHYNQEDNYFWGLTADYGRRLGPLWSVSSSLAFDQEHDRPPTGPKTVVNTFNLVVAINATVTRWLTLTTGVGKGFLDDDNPDQKLKFTDGDWATGLAAGILLPKPPFSDAWNLSVAWEWNLTKKAPSVSSDLAVSWSF